MEIEIIYLVIIVWFILTVVSVLKIGTLRNEKNSNEKMYLDEIGYKIDRYENGEIYFVKNNGKYVVLKLNESNDMEIITNDKNIDNKKVQNDYSKYELFMQLKERY